MSVIFRRSSVVSICLITPVLLGLAGCNAFSRPDDRACPHVRIDSATAEVTRFAPGGRDVTDQVLTAVITGVEGDCSYDKSGVTAEMNISFELELGPAAPASREVGFTYFVALPEYFPAASAKQTYPVAVRFPANTHRIIYRDEKISIRIPLPPDQTAAQTDIYVGLQLNADELEYNRGRTGRGW